jgi:hypothetical protein
MPNFPGGLRQFDHQADGLRSVGPRTARHRRVHQTGRRTPFVPSVLHRTLGDRDTAVDRLAERRRGKVFLLHACVGIDGGTGLGHLACPHLCPAADLARQQRSPASHERPDRRRRHHGRTGCRIVHVHVGFGGPHDRGQARFCVPRIARCPVDTDPGAQTRSATRGHRSSRRPYPGARTAVPQALRGGPFA